MTASPSNPIKYMLLLDIVRNGDPMLRQGTDRCWCAECGVYFNSSGAFQRHRVVSSWKDRRCLSVGEMRRSGWSQNKTGHWVREKLPIRRAGGTEKRR